MSKLSFYPNPVKDILNVSSEAVITEVVIYNLLGPQVLAKSLNANEGSFDVSNLISGTYLMKATTGKGTVNTQFIKN